MVYLFKFGITWKGEVEVPRGTWGVLCIFLFGKLSVYLSFLFSFFIPILIILNKSWFLIVKNINNCSSMFQESSILGVNFPIQPFNIYMHII